MRGAIQWLVLETRIGDLMLRAFEKLSGMAMVKVDELNCRAEATPKGEAAAKNRAPTRA